MSTMHPYRVHSRPGPVATWNGGPNHLGYGTPTAPPQSVSVGTYGYGNVPTDPAKAPPNTNPFQAYFATPALAPKPQYPTRENLDYPDSFEVLQDAVKDVLIQMITQQAVVFVTRIYPWRRTDNVDGFRWIRIKYNQHVLNPRAPEAPSRLLTHTGEEREVAMTYFGIALMMEWDFMTKTPMGGPMFRAHLQQITNATITTAVLDVCTEIMEGEEYQDRNAPQNYNPGQLSQLLDEETHDFGILTKNPQTGFMECWDKLRSMIEAREHGVSPNVFIVPYRAINYAARSLTGSFLTTGLVGLQPRPDQATAIYNAQGQRQGGVALVETPIIKLGDRLGTRNVGDTTATFGQFFRALWTDCLHDDHYSTDRRTIATWNEQEGIYYQRELTEMLTYCGLFSNDEEMAPGLTDIGAEFFSGYANVRDYLHDQGCLDTVVKAMSANVGAVTRLGALVSATVLEGPPVGHPVGQGSGNSSSSLSVADPMYRRPLGGLVKDTALVALLPLEAKSLYGRGNVWQRLQDSMPERANRTETASYMLPVYDAKNQDWSDERVPLKVTPEEAKNNALNSEWYDSLRREFSLSGALDLANNRWSVPLNNMANLGTIYSRNGHSVTPLFERALRSAFEKDRVVTVEPVQVYGRPHFAASVAADPHLQNAVRDMMQELADAKVLSDSRGRKTDLAYAPFYADILEAMALTRHAHPEWPSQIQELGYAMIMVAGVAAHLSQLQKDDKLGKAQRQVLGEIQLLVGLYTAAAHASLLRKEPTPLQILNTEIPVRTYWGSMGNHRGSMSKALKDIEVGGTLNKVLGKVVDSYRGLMAQFAVPDTSNAEDLARTLQRESQAAGVPGEQAAALNNAADMFDELKKAPADQTFDGVVALLRNLDINHIGSFFVICKDHDIPVALSFYYFEPNITFMMSRAAVLKDGGGTGSTMMAIPDLLFSRSATLKMLVGHFTVKMKAVTTNPENKAVHQHAAFRAYVHGAAVTPWPCTADMRIAYSNGAAVQHVNHFGGFWVAVPPREKCKRTRMDITGRFHPSLDDSPGEHYSTCQYYRRAWGWTHSNESLVTKHKSFTSYVPGQGAPRSNTMIFQGAQFLFPKEKPLKTFIEGCGHLGAAPTPGSNKSRNGKGYAAPANFGSEAITKVVF